MRPDRDGAAELADRAYRFLARRDRSRAEMQRYLEHYCADTEIVARLLDDLQERGCLSDSRLADQLIRSRRARGSASRLRQEMARRGVADEVIAASTAGLDACDLQLALALWQKRFRAAPADLAQREKQLRYLRNRGFGHALALQVLRAVGTEGAAENEE